jgi:hypothetical protein
MTSVSGTGEHDWIEKGRQATFYFTDPAYRQEFKTEFPRFFRRVKVVDQSDELPAPRSSAF